MKIIDLRNIILVITVMMLCSAIVNAFQGPDNIYFGAVKLNDVPAPPGTAIELKRAATSETLATYSMKSNPEIGENYLLKVATDIPTDPSDVLPPGTVRYGDEIISLVNGEQAASMIIEDPLGFREVNLTSTVVSAVGVPTLSQWGVIMLILALLCQGIHTIRKQYPVHT